MQSEYFTAIQSKDLDTLYPPEESYADFLERMPRKRQPNAQDIFDRWDLFTFACNHKDCSEFKQEIVAQYAPKCKCGNRKINKGSHGVGERRAYLAWLTGLMSKDEYDFFWTMVVANHADNLLMLAAVPLLRQMVGHVAQLEQRIQDLEVASVAQK